MAHKSIILFFSLLVSGFISGQNLDSISIFPGFARDDAVAEFSNGKIYCGLGYAVGFQVMGDWWSYTLENGTWEKFDNVPFEKRQYSSSLIWENYIYIFAGWTSDNKFHNDLWRFNCNEKSWEEMQPMPSRPRWGTMAIKIGDKGLFGLGQDTAEYFRDSWVYDFKYDSWFEASIFPGEGRSKMLGVELNGLALIGLGQGKTKNHNDLWVYNPLQNNWNEINYGFDSLAYMSFSNYGNYVYFSGGQDYRSAMSSSFKVLSFENVLEPKTITSLNIEPKARGNMILDNNQNVFLLWGLDSLSRRTKKLEQVVYDKKGDLSPIIKIYPNPAKDQILIQSDEKFKGLKIVNSAGLVISDLKFNMANNRTVDVSGLDAGIYFLNLDNEGLNNSSAIILIQ